MYETNNYIIRIFIDNFNLIFNFIGIFMKKMLIVFALFMGAFLVAEAQQIQKRSMSDLMPYAPAVRIGVLDNGLKYYIRENNLPANRAELRLVVMAGSVQEDDDQKGLSHFVEHMCFNGTKNFPKNDLINFLEATGMRFGADINANTGFDRTYYLLTIPLDKPGLLEQGFQVLEDWAHNVTFDPEEIEKERGVILEEWRVYRGAQERVMRSHYPYLLYDSKYADRLPIGDTAVILNAPRETFLRYYNEWYRPDLMAVIAVGDFNKDDIEKIIKEKFSRLKNPQNARPRKVYPVGMHKETFVSIAKDKELPMPNLAVLYKHPGRESATYGAYRYGLLDQFVNNMLNMRIQELTRKPNPPFLFAGAFSSEFIASLRAFQVISISKTDDILRGMEAAVTESYRAKQHGFTQSELDRAKTTVLTAVEKAYNERDKSKSEDYAEEYYRNFYEGEAMPGIEYEYNIVKEFHETITLVEVNKYLASLITEENKVIILSAPDKEDINIPTEKQILDAYDRIAKSKLEPYEDDATDKPLMDKKPKPGKITQTKVHKDKFDIVEMTLSNGAKVLVKQTDFKNDEVLFTAWSPGGSSLSGDDMFRDAMLADVIVNEGGISEFRSTTLTKMMAGKIVRLTPSIGPLTEGFNGMYSPKDEETFFQLLHLYFTNPRKDSDAFQSLISRQKESIRNSKRNPESFLQDTIAAVFNGYHPRFMPLVDTELDKVSLDRAMQFYNDRFADASDFTFIFVGAVNLDKLKNMLETYVASLPSKKRKETWRDLGVKHAQGPFTKEVIRGIEPKSTIRLVLSDKFDYKPQNLLHLNAMMEVFRIRLREVIREDKGGVYGIGAMHRVDQFPKPRYSIYIFFGTSVDRVQELIADAKKVIAELKNNPISDEYMTKAKEILKREFETNRKENRFWLNQIYNSDFNRLDLSRLNNFEANVDALTGKDIHEAAKKYLIDDKMMKFILNPED